MNEKQEEKEEEWTEEELIAEALQHYWEGAEDSAMIPSRSSCYVSHGRVYICNSNEILATYRVKTLTETT